MEGEAMSISATVSSRFASLPHKSHAAPSVKRDEFGIVGNSAAARRLRLQVRRIGPHFRNVLVRGEAGTEKELIARALHGMGQSARASFVVCHAAAFDDALADPNVRAASGDDLSHLMKMSQRGTLFLDEVSEMSLEAQGRLLHLLERHDVAQNRMEASRRMDLRMVASTCEDLRVLVSTGRFRHELYQRLATVEITVPPLRERVEDLPELVRHSLEWFALLYGKSVPEVAEDSMVRMRRYHWPGNVHELEGALRYGMLQSDDGLFELHHLPMTGRQQRAEPSATGASESVRLQDVVEQHVLRVLKECGGNKLRAAEALGISRSTLYRMLDTSAASSWRQRANC
jgi:DNA-binding NtrC family response regulator